MKKHRQRHLRPHVYLSGHFEARKLPFKEASQHLPEWCQKDVRSEGVRRMPKARVSDDPFIEAAARRRKNYHQNHNLPQSRIRQAMHCSLDHRIMPEWEPISGISGSTRVCS